MKLMIISDMHLSAYDADYDPWYQRSHLQDDNIYSMLYHAFGRDVERIILCGDIIEMYQCGILPGRKKRLIKKIRSKYPRTFNLLEDKNWQPIPIIILDGNHDSGMLTKIQSVNIGGYHFEHGHRGDDFLNNKFAKVLSETFTRILYVFEYVLGRIIKKKITWRWIQWIRKRRVLARTHRTYGTHIMMSNSKLKGCVLGHTHTKDYLPVGNRTYLNSGTYVMGDILFLDTDTDEYEHINIGGHYVNNQQQNDFPVDVETW